MHQFKKGCKVTRCYKICSYESLKKLYCQSRKPVSLSVTYQFVDYSTYLSDDQQKTKMTLTDKEVPVYISAIALFWRPIKHIYSITHQTKVLKL